MKKWYQSHFKVLFLITYFGGLIWYIFIHHIGLALLFQTILSSALIFGKEYYDCKKENPTYWSWEDVKNGYCGYSWGLIAAFICITTFEMIFGGM